MRNCEALNKEHVIIKNVSIRYWYVYYQFSMQLLLVLISAVVFPPICFPLIQHLICCIDYMTKYYAQ